LPPASSPASRGPVSSDRRHSRAHCAPLSDSIGPLAELIKAVRVKDRRVAVLGNHDRRYGRGSRGGRLRCARERVSRERVSRAFAGREYIVLTGLDDVHRFYTPNALGPCLTPQKGFGSPWCTLRRLPITPQRRLCSLPLWPHPGRTDRSACSRPIITHLLLCRHTSAGLWSEGDMVGYTSRGLGVGNVP